MPQLLVVLVLAALLFVLFIGKRTFRSSEDIQNLGKSLIGKETVVSNDTDENSADKSENNLENRLEISLASGRIKLSGLLIEIDTIMIKYKLYKLQIKMIVIVVTYLVVEGVAIVQAINLIENAMGHGVVNWLQRGMNLEFIFQGDLFTTLNDDAERFVAEVLNMEIEIHWVIKAAHNGSHVYWRAKN